MWYFHLNGISCEWDQAQNNQFEELLNGKRPHFFSQISYYHLIHFNVISVMACLYGFKGNTLYVLYTEG